MLEHRHGLHIVERVMSKNSPADIIVNEIGCMIVTNFSNVAGLDDLKNRMGTFIERLVLLSTQFKECAILIELYDNDTATLDAFDDCLKYCSVFCSRMSSMTLSMNMHVKYLFSQTIEESAELIRGVVSTMEKLANETRKTDRIWIKEEEPKHVKFLSLFPGLNVSNSTIFLTY